MARVADSHGTLSGLRRGEHYAGSDGQEPLPSVRRDRPPGIAGKKLPGSPARFDAGEFVGVAHHVAARDATGDDVERKHVADRPPTATVIHPGWPFTRTRRTSIPTVAFFAMPTRKRATRSATRIGARAAVTLPPPSL